MKRFSGAAEKEPRHHYEKGASRKQLFITWLILENNIVSISNCISGNFSTKKKNVNTHNFNNILTKKGKVGSA